MGTCNFHTVNARNVFVLLDYFEEDGERYENEWSFLKDDIKEYGLTVGWMDALCKSFEFGREVDTAIICQEFWFQYKNSGLKYLITAYITINPGHYEHSNLDYRLVIDCCDSDTPKEDVADIIVDDFIDDKYGTSLCYLSNGVGTKIWNNGLRKMQKHNFEKAITKFVDHIIEECEIMCHNLSHDVYQKVGVFSNGEGIYEKIAE